MYEQFQGILFYQNALFEASKFFIIVKKHNNE